MDIARLKKACEGKMASQGGMNLPEIKDLAKSSGVKQGTREAMLKEICIANGISVPQKKQKPAKTQQPAKTKKVTTPQQAAKPVPPSFARGLVKQKTEEWLARKPISSIDRKSLLDTCGESCFLEPKGLKYPVCSKENTCKIDCDGLRAANGLATILSNSKKIKPEASVAAVRAILLAGELGKKHCNWN